jgi:hypothetical protein
MTFRYLHFAFVTTEDADIQPHHRSLEVLQISENTIIQFGLYCKIVSGHRHERSYGSIFLQVVPD